MPSFPDCLLVSRTSSASHVRTINMFGSWKARHEISADDEAVEDILSEIEEELSAFLLRQRAWPVISQAKKLPTWMKTSSLNRCERTPPLPPKVRPIPPPPTPPARRRSGSRLARLGSAEIPSVISSTCSPTPPIRRRRPSGSSSVICGSSPNIVRRSASLHSIDTRFPPHSGLSVNGFSLTKKRGLCALGYH